VGGGKLQISNRRTRKCEVVGAFIVPVRAGNQAPPGDPEEGREAFREERTMSRNTGGTLEPLLTLWKRYGNDAELNGRPLTKVCPKQRGCRVQNAIWSP